MSEENNANSSKVQGNIDSKDDSSSISSSQNEKVNFSAIPTEQEVDFSRNSMKDESNISLSDPLSEEHKENASTVAMDSSSDFQKSHSSNQIHSYIVLTENSSATQSSTSETATSQSISSSTTSQSGSSSSEGSNRRQIEESIREMIKHIENEIEHVALNENHFQNIELKIKTSRVMVAIEQTIQKLEIAFCLPWMFVENFNEMSLLCGETNISKLMHEYCAIRDSEDIDVCRFQPTVINCINDAFQAGLGRFVDLHRKKLPEREAKFLSTIVQFKYMAEWQMGMSAIKAMNKEKTLHKMWTSNEKIKSKIKDMESQFENYRIKLQELVYEKNSIIATHKETISDLEKRNAHDINAEIFKSNKAMRRVCMTSEEKQKILAAELHHIKETYEKLIQSNLIVEKTLRDQKSKTRQKLQAVLTKYDTGVGERFAELLRIRNELEDETLLYENKVKEFQLQEIEYNQIMFDKAEVDAKIREEKLILFMMNRSARIIQRAYKKMMKKRKKGKKGKKGKKSKKK